ncbi:MAG: uridine diphosphate-N-acetylglucosamine-binding protein YvcK [Candidatus Aenigmarchaeota archaeon]|nr:uridine diphosphate-N-acetylglucosamine-binding protein YvcK [Candidatus Aenigmarchaeota archaeon]
MSIKAIIFDLDDTLYDCGVLRKQAMKRAAKSMIADGLPLSENRAYKKQIEYLEKFGPRCDVFNKMAEEFGVKEKNFVENALKAYNNDDVGKIESFPGASETLIKLRKKYRLILITAGLHIRQMKKIEALGLKDKFDEIVINDIEKDPDKVNDFERVLKKSGFCASEFVVVGDRINSEILIGNKLRMKTVQMLFGKYSDVKPKDKFEEPDYKIKRITELPLVIKILESEREPKIVCIGGGTGLSRILKGLKKYTNDITAIVTVTDAGRSSGIIREELKILPPADIKNCLIALSERSEHVQNLLRYRFEGKGRLGDMSFGNLFIAALTKITGSFEEAVKEAGEILHIKGRVLPVTLEDCHICAELEDGTVFKKDYEIYKREDKARIKIAFLEPEASALPECLKEIESADLVVIGPGSLYTSIITNLLMKGMKESLEKTRAKIIYISNLVTQKGQTEGYLLSDHIKDLEKYMGKTLDYIIVNKKSPDKKSIEKYKMEGLEIVTDDIEESYFKKIKEDILWEMKERPDRGKHDPDIMRHDPEKIAGVLINLINGVNR